MIGRIIDLLNPWAWRADKRDVRNLQLTEQRDESQRIAILGASYIEKPPTPRRASISRAVGLIGGPIETKTSYGPWSVTHRFVVKCAGPAPAQETHVWLAYGDDNNTRRTAEQRLGLLRVGEDHTFELVEDEFLGGRVPRDGSLMCRWTDGNGPHVESLLAITVHI